MVVVVVKLLLLFRAGVVWLVFKKIFFLDFWSSDKSQALWKTAKKASDKIFEVDSRNL